MTVLIAAGPRDYARKSRGRDQRFTTCTPKTERPGLARPQIGWRRLSASTGYCPHPSNPAPLHCILQIISKWSIQENLLSERLNAAPVLRQPPHRYLTDFMRQSYCLL